jgi:molybdopterin/thiamine biosynthesis adenylyltransferase
MLKVAHSDLTIHNGDRLQISNTASKQFLIRKKRKQMYKVYALPIVNEFTVEFKVF